MPGVENHSEDSSEQNRSLASSWNFQKNTKTRCWWLMPIILSTQEAEIRRIVLKASLDK
jgi:hypothetical protein